MHHKSSSCERFQLPKNEGGIGITNMHNLHINQVKSLGNHFHSKTYNSHLSQITCDPDINYMPLNLHDTLPQHNENIRMMQERITTWMSRTLHGRHAYDH